MFFLSGLSAQTLTKRVFGIEDGLQQIECKGLFTTPEGRLYVMQIDGTCTEFDGYGFYPMENNFGLPKAEVTNSRQTERGTFLHMTGSESFALRAFHGSEGDFRILPVQPKSHEEGVNFERDSILYWTPDSLFYYDFAQDTFLFSREMPAFFKNNYNDQGNFSFDFDDNDKDIVYHNHRPYRRQTDDSWTQINDYAEIVPEFPATLAQLRRLGYDTARIDQYRLLRTLRESTATRYAPRQLHPLHWEGKDRYLLFDHKTKDFLGLSPAGTGKYIPVAVYPGTHWNTSHVGLYRFQNHIKFYPSGENGLPNALHTVVQNERDEILAGGYSDGWARWEQDTFVSIPASFEYPRILPHAHPAPDGRGILYFAESGPHSLSRLHEGRVQAYYPQQSANAPTRFGGHPNGRFTGYFIDTLRDGRLALGTSRLGLGLVNGMAGDSVDVRFIGKEKGMDLVNVLHFMQDTKDRVWMGRSSRGVALYDPAADTVRTWARTGDNPRSFGSISGTTDERGNLWFGGHDGLYFLNNPHEISIATTETDFFAAARRIELPDGFRGAVFSMTEVDSFLVFGNGSGLHFLNLARFYREPALPWIYTLRFGEDIEGGGAEQNAILFDRQRRLWLGCQEGLLQMDWDRFVFDTTTNKILLRQVRAGNDTLTVTDNTVTLPVDNRNCSVRFGPELNYSMLKNIFFDYYLLSPAGDTLQAVHYDQEGIFEQAAFAPGDYRLLIEARKHGRLMEQRDILIRVPRTLSESPWFWATIASVFLAGLVAFLLFRQKQQRLLAAKELALARSENEKNNLQIQAIISSFNPHFINNSLHWVQSRYNKDENMVRLIGRLSENIHLIFSNTRRGKAHHSVAEELTLVRNYIHIQKIRFNNNFRYEEVLPADTQALQTNILLMHLQIHVENAVEHGLRNREAGSYVRVTIQDNADALLIDIEDDGCGRPRARRIGSKGTQTGTTMLRGLIEIFNNANAPEIITQEYEDDIFADAHGRYGTRVRIRYPKKISYELGKTKGHRSR